MQSLREGRKGIFENQPMTFIRIFRSHRTRRDDARTRPCRAGAIHVGAGDSLVFSGPLFPIESPDRDLRLQIRVFVLPERGLKTGWGE